MKDVRCPQCWEMFPPRSPQGIHISCEGVCMPCEDLNENPDEVQPPESTEDYVRMDTYVPRAARILCTP